MKIEVPTTTLSKIATPGKKFLIVIKIGVVFQTVLSIKEREMDLEKDRKFLYPGIYEVIWRKSKKIKVKTEHGVVEYLPPKTTVFCLM